YSYLCFRRNFVTVPFEKQASRMLRPATGACRRDPKRHFQLTQTREAHPLRFPASQRRNLDRSLQLLRVERRSHTLRQALQAERKNPVPCVARSASAPNSPLSRYSRSLAPPSALIAVKPCKISSTVKKDRVFR